MHTDDLDEMSPEQVDGFARQADRILIAEVDECTERSVALAEHLITSGASSISRIVDVDARKYEVTARVL